MRGDDLRVGRRRRAGAIGPVEGEDGNPGRFHELEGDGDLLGVGGEGGRRCGAVAVETISPGTFLVQDHPTETPPVVAVLSSSLVEVDVEVW